MIFRPLIPPSAIDLVDERRVCHLVVPRIDIDDAGDGSDVGVGDADLDTRRRDTVPVLGRALR